MGAPPPPMGWLPTLAIFAGAGLLLYVATHLLIPALAGATGVEPIAFWFLVGGLSVFAPLVAVGVFLLRREESPHAPWRTRLRFRRMDRGDWVWAMGALVIVVLLTGMVQTTLGLLAPESGVGPGFMTLEPLSSGRYWILAAWLPFWVLNIMGEEFLWRGVMLPRQEAALGDRAWLANAVGWTLFHLAFGWHLLLLLLPILLILPYVVQRRRNSWVGVVVHAGLNGPGFLAVAFGLV
jgi:membrane protease YdiL (CAAX protease family)